MKVTINTPTQQLSLSFVAEATGGLLVTSQMTHHAVRHLCTDSREVDPQTLFCAMRGERVDGHHYMKSAGELGCVAFLCERIPQDLSTPYVAVVVDDTVAALSRLARAYRDTYLEELIPVAVTGSVGKTTTKECIASVLSQGHEIFKKEGNYNSVIGLPLSVLEISPDTHTAVLEMGMSGVGEISAMSQAVLPHIAVITNIGHAHMELLGSQYNIAKAKAEMVDGMGEGDILVVNGDDDFICAVRPDMEERGVEILDISMKNPMSDFYVSSVKQTDQYMTFDITHGAQTWHQLTMPALGRHMVWAAAFAVAVGQCMGMDETHIRQGLLAYTPAEMRQSVSIYQGMTFIEDCYNASPESMRAAFSVLSMTDKSGKGRMVAVLGDMKELGDESDWLHINLGHALTEAAQGRELYLVTVGALGAKIAQGAVDAGLGYDHIYVSNENAPYMDACNYLSGLLKKGDTVLFKASRAMQLERMVAQIKNVKI